MILLLATMFHHAMTTPIWTEEKALPFTELILSWNGERPDKGSYAIYAKVKTEDWSPWLLYARFGKEGQSTFAEETPSVHLYQDAIEIREGKQATGFAIRIEAEGGADISGIRHLHAFTNGALPSPVEVPLFPVSLPVRALSQMHVEHPRFLDLCSPTSTIAVIRYLLQDDTLDPSLFAKRVRDETFDIFGNWVLNVAEASHLLGPDWTAWVERLSSFSALLERLKTGTPVIVSVRGPLPGSALPYAKGHLLVVTGFDPETNEVLCMDPAFDSLDKNLVRYQQIDFLTAWERRGWIAYVFRRQNLH